LGRRAKSFDFIRHPCTPQSRRSCILRRKHPRISALMSKTSAGVHDEARQLPVGVINKKKAGRGLLKKKRAN